jgi:paraquat-inducible protein B
MKRKSHPMRIGLFMLGAVALLVAAVVLVSGGGLFASRERAVAYFDGSVYGLQLGAPVVFRGVRLGSVVGIGLDYQGSSGQFAIPVELEIDRHQIRSVMEPSSTVSLPELVAKGLSAQLSTQRLLTGLLYVDLDLRPGVRTRSASVQAPRAPGSAKQEVVEIPTVATTLQAFQQQLQDVDLGKLVGDVSAVAAGVRELVTSPKIRHTVDELAAASTELRQLLARVNQRVGPLSDSVQGTLGATRRTAEQWGGVVDRVGDAVDRVGRASDRVSGTMGRVDSLADAAQPALDSVRRAADDLAQTAAALRSATAEDSGLMLQVERAAQDMARASRAVRDLADLLERQPEALIRGRRANP